MRLIRLLMNEGFRMWQGQRFRFQCRQHSKARPAGAGRPAFAGLLLSLFLTACTLPAYPEGPERGSEPVRLEPDMMRLDDGFLLPVRRWTPVQEPQAILLALHGFNDYGMSFDPLAKSLLERRILTVAIDQRGFGETEGRGRWHGEERMREDVRQVLRELRKTYPDTPLYLLGKSMGGAMAMTVMSNEPVPDVDGTILVAPAVWARDTMPWYQRWALAIGVRIAPGRTVSPEGLSIDPSDNTEMLREWSRDPLVITDTRIDAIYGLGNLMDQGLAASGALKGETLILYGENDEVIPPRPTCRMLMALPDQDSVDWRFVLYPDGWHMLTRDLQQQRVHADIAAWILDRETRLPSGMERDRDTAIAQLCD
ncbi:lysophospholipase [Methylonatrum kenyense]|uniref:alpha/beta hydrolase n=1 Tax=Methylonatrum kenyense TaxID=455253 RepID=UPI0020BFCB25|nr:alpha/beta hydrolase [Methylonatrum kenyense]MCK8516320.1 lysophospholipase [Methylonatrum kenyense]